MAELLHGVVVEAAATFAVALLSGLCVYAFRMWELPKLQRETIQELRELRLSIGQMSEAVRKSGR